MDTEGNLFISGFTGKTSREDVDVDGTSMETQFIYQFDKTVIVIDKVS